MQSLLYLQAYKHYQVGVMPSAGGWLEQPAKLLDALAVIEDELAIISSEKAEQEDARRRTKPKVRA